MDAPNPTTANEDLWTAYARTAWRPWLDPVVGWGWTDRAAKSIADWTSSLIGTSVSALFEENAPHVTRFVRSHRSGLDTQPLADAAGVPAWLLTNPPAEPVVDQPGADEADVGLASEVAAYP